MKWTIGIVATVIALIVGAVVRAYVIAQLWGWYIAPALHVPAISMTTAFGISLLAGLFIPTPQPAAHMKGKELPELVGAMIGEFLGQLLICGGVLVIGWLVHDSAMG